MRARAVLGVALAGAALAACDKHSPDKHAAPSSSAPAPAATKTAPPPEAPAVAAATASSPEQDEALHASDAGSTGPWILDDLADVGPAAPASASPRGVVMVTKDDHALLAALGESKAGRGKDAAPTPITPIAAGATFAPFARPPAVLDGYAYFTSRGRLVRARFDGAGALEVLASDALDDARVAVTGPAPATAAYVGRGATEGATRAMLWVEGGGTTNLSPDGSSSSSVALVADGGARMLLSLDGRTGMTPLHARRVELAGNKPAPKDDVVVWVAGPSHSLTEVAGVASHDGVWAFVPLERDITRFGLASVDVGSEPKMGAPVTWRAYPNGIDPAPVAAGKLCGSPVVVYASPAEASPRSPEQLEMAAVADGKLGPGVVLARSRQFVSVSVAETAHGGLVAWVSGSQTWARSVRCSPARK